jgi:Ca2+-binding RTX toxin-like protein
MKTSTFGVALATCALLVAPLTSSASSAAGLAARVTCHGRVATIVGTPGDDFLRGTKRADVIAGQGGDDGIRGGGGNDVICGGAGLDDIRGGNGDNRLLGGAGNDAIRARGGNDFIAGNDGKDFIVASIGRNIIWGGAGDDDISSPYYAWGRNLIHGGSGNDEISLVNWNDDVYAGPGDDVIYSGPVSVGSGHVLDGGLGNNWLRFSVKRNPSGALWHQVLIDFARGRIEAGGEVSLIPGRFNAFYLDPGGAEAYTINGTDDADEIHSFVSYSSRGGPDVVVRGHGGDDIIETQRGNDTLRGGPGLDHASAGGGVDTCSSIEAPLAGETDTGCEVSTP